MSQDDVEAQVRATRGRGDFERLPGLGKPLPLDDLDGLSAEQRFEALLMRSIGEVSAKVAVVREIRACRALIERSGCAEERERARVTAREKINELQQLLMDGR